MYFNGTWLLDFIVMIFTANSETLNTQKAYIALFQNVGWYRLNRDEKKFTYIRGNIYIWKGTLCICQLLTHISYIYLLHLWCCVWNLVPSAF